MKAPFLFPLDQLTSVDAAIAKPFIKWAGGKQAISSTLTNYFPDSYGKYFEPFIGGGSVFFSTQPQDAVIGDLNTWLVDTYVAIRDSWEDVATILDSMPNFSLISVVLLPPPWTKILFPCILENRSRTCSNPLESSIRLPPIFTTDNFCFICLFLFYNVSFPSILATGSDSHIRFGRFGSIIINS